MLVPISSDKPFPSIDSLTSAGSIFSYLESLGVTPTQSMGQNFLADRPLIEALARTVCLESEDRVIEIGPGLGHLTRVLCERCRKVLAIEKDRRLADTLAGRLGEPDNLTVISEDILEVPVSEIETWREGKKTVFIGNLPYYCSSQILIRLFQDWLPIWNRCGFLLQEEVVDRLVASPGTKAYGRLSVLAQLYSHPRKTRKVLPHLFVPRPEVTSAWLVLEIREEAPPVSADRVGQVTGICFAERRKTLLNNLGRAIGKETARELLQRTKIPGDRRAETLSPTDFLHLTEAYADFSPPRPPSSSPSG